MYRTYAKFISFYIDLVLVNHLESVLLDMEFIVDLAMVCILSSRTEFKKIYSVWIYSKEHLLVDIRIGRLVLLHMGILHEITILTVTTITIKCLIQT